MNPTNVRRFMIAFAAALAIMGSSAGQAQAGIFTINYSNTGWWNVVGDQISGNQNYISGFNTAFNAGGQWRNYFVFDLTGVTGTVVGASLEVYNPVNGTGANLRTWSLFDVSTPIATLTAGGTGQTAIYNDLGTGVNLGNNSGPQNPNTIISTNLNAAGLAYIQAGLGGLLAFGGDYVGALNGDYLYAYSGGSSDEVRRIVITTADAPVAVPVPAGIVMSSIGVLGLGGFTWLRRRKPNAA